MDVILNAHPVAVIALAAIATMMFLPGSVTMTLAGFLYGMGPGFIIAAIAIPLGAQCAFEFARWAARPWVQRQIAANKHLQLYEMALRDEAFTIIALSRLSLVIPFNVFNYVCGATAVRSSTYFLATAIGMLPALALYVYLGTLAQDIGQILSGDSTPTQLSWWLLGAGVVLLIVLVSIVRGAAKRALEKQLQSREI